MVERLVRDQEAVGSNPTSPIKVIPRQGQAERFFDFFSGVNVHSKSKFLLVIVSAAQLALFSARAVSIDIYVDRPPGVINFVYPEYPAKLAAYNWSGKGRFLLRVDAKTGVVEEVKVLKTTGHVILNELAAKAFFQWRFQPGGQTHVQVSCEYYAHGFSRQLH